jgi:putative transposase
MDPLKFIGDFLSDQENGTKTLITWLLNQAMLQEAPQQVGADLYERADARKAHRNGYKDRHLKTRNSGSSRSRRRSSGAMPGWRRLL